MSLSFVWRIENFSFCWPRTGDVLRSPKFASPDFSHLQYSLSLYPKGRRKADRIDCRLTLETSGDDYGADLSMEFSFLNGAGKPQKKSDWVRKELATGEFLEYSVEREEIFQKRALFLPHDTLTLRCCLLVNDVECNNDFQNVFATTHIRVERISFLWSIGEFSTFDKNEEKITPVDSVSEDCPDFRFRLCPKKDTDEVGVRIVQLTTERENFVKCRMLLVTKSGAMADSVVSEQWYHKYRVKKPWQLPAFLSREKLLKNKETFLPGDVLSLRCELEVSLGERKSGGSQPSRTPKSTSTRSCQTDDLLMSPTENDTTESTLKDDLKELYRDKQLCDFILKVGSKSFPVHKSLLVARSPVFRAMFQKDMLGDTSGTLDIPDLDPSTLDRMLAFVYFDEIERSGGWKQSAKLYSAADKYHLLPLKEECRGMLKSGLDSSNAWEVLLVADRHQDEDLKKTVQAFILAQEKSIIESEGERKPKRGKAPQTLHQVYLNAASSKKARPNGASFESSV